MAIPHAWHGARQKSNTKRPRRGDDVSIFNGPLLYRIQIGLFRKVVNDNLCLIELPFNLERFSVE